MDKPEIYIPFSWVAVWLWGDRSARNPCHGFLDPNTNECLRAFVAYPDEHWPNHRQVFPRPIEAADTVEIRLEAENPRELRAMREMIRGVLTTM